MATTTILGVFDSADAARHALGELNSSGLHLHDTSLVAQGDHGDDKLNAPEGALLGAAWGGFVGLVALAIPGIGPFIAGGAIAAALTGAAAGAVVGGLGGALIHSNNLREEDAKRYEEQVQAGKTLLVVKAEEADALEVRRILAQDGANSIRENQTDMLNGTGVQVDMYDEQGSPMPHTPAYSGTQNVEGPASLISPATITPTGSEATTRGASPELSDASADARTTSSGTGREDSFDTEDIPATGQTMENGARVVSYEEEDASKRETPTAPKLRDV